jgi:hypothetical protein
MMSQSLVCPFLQGDSSDAKVQRKITQSFRAVPWSIRLVFKVNYKQTNYLEIKKLEPTLTKDGVVGSYSMARAPYVVRGDACPCAYCANLSFDKDRGVVCVAASAVQAARVLVSVVEPEEDEEITTPDTNARGLRVARHVRCALGDADSEDYTVKTAGVSGSVQWLATAAAGATFLMTVQVRGSDGAFNVLAHMNTSEVGTVHWRNHMRKHLEQARGVAIAHSVEDTPQKRQETHDKAMPTPSAKADSTSFSKRIKLA